MAGGRKRVAIKRPVDMEMGIARPRRRLELRRSGVWVWRPYRFHRVLVIHSRHIGIGNSNHLFSARSYIAEPTSRQTHVRLMKIPVLRGLHIKLTRTCASFNSPALISRRFARYLPNWNLPTSSSGSRTAAEQHQHTFTATLTLLSVKF